VSWKQAVIALAAIFAVMWLTGEAMKWLAPWTEARSMARDNPALAHLPALLPDQSLAVLSDNPIMIFGLTVHTAWSRFGTIQSAPGLAIIPFPERHIEMLLYEPHQDNFEMVMWNITKAGSMKTGSSSYELLAAEMATTPDQVKWWRSPYQNEARSFLLEMKSLTLTDMRVIYLVNIGGWHGFQEGNPAVPPYRVRLDLFDLADYHYELVISAKGDGRPAFSQAEINALVASLKPIPHN
jgi:hypothetical protein